MNIKELLKEGVVFLGKNNKTSLLDCEILLRHVLGAESGFLVAHHDDEVFDGEEKMFRSYLKRVKNGEPIAYITNEKEFFGLNFFVDKRVLIPRPETEMVVEETLDFFESVKDLNECVYKVLDVGTGSGNIAISIAKIFSENGGMVEVDALDISENALEVASLNTQQHGVEDRVRLFQSDLLENLDDEEEFDVITANLPYIGEEIHRHVAKETEEYEPVGALFGGQDGLALYKKMFQQISNKNIRFKRMFGEFGYGQREDLEALLSKYFEHNWRIKKDLAGIDRMFIVDL